jgi:hypothetical protein
MPNDLPFFSLLLKIEVASYKFEGGLMTEDWVKSYLFPYPKPAFLLDT